MELIDATGIFSALGHETRLALFRRLLRSAPEAISAGVLALELDIPPSTLTSHLQILQRSGLIRSRRESRTILYSVRAETVQSIVGFLVRDCCRGRPELCGTPLPVTQPDPAR
jgi:ArsR family transcriptional regulator, arsenate/arsenite/antimonite-responsive transcriptional repressor